MNRNILDIVNEIISNGITWQETIVLGLFIVGVVFVTLLCTKALVSVTNIIANSITTSLTATVQVLQTKDRKRT